MNDETNSITVAPATMKDLVDEAEKYDFNRQLIWDRISKFRLFSLKPVMLHSHIAGEPVSKDLIHVRCMVSGLMTTNGKHVSTHIGFLDIVLSTWGELNSAKEDIHSLFVEVLGNDFI